MSRRATRSPADLEGVARLVQTLQTLRAGKDRVLAPELDEALRRGLRPWLPQDLDHLRDCLRRNDPQLASKFSEWRGQHLGGVLRRTLRRLGPHRSRR